MAQLTRKQQRFVAEYLLDLNATQAAIRAGYSRKTAYSVGSENLRKPYIAAEIEKAIEKRAERTRVTADKVVTELARLGFSNMRDYATWSGHEVSLKSSEELSEDDTAAVTEVTETVGEFGSSVKIKLGHKDSALKLLAQHVGLLGGDSDPVGKMADSFMAGVHTVKEMAAERDLSE